MLNSLWANQYPTEAFCNFWIVVIKLWVTPFKFIHNQMNLKVVRVSNDEQSDEGTENFLLFPLLSFIVGNINRFDGLRSSLRTTTEQLHSCGKRSDYEPVAPEHHWGGSIATDEHSGVTSLRLIPLRAYVISHHCHRVRQAVHAQADKRWWKPRQQAPGQGLSVFLPWKLQKRLEKLICWATPNKHWNKLFHNTLAKKLTVGYYLPRQQNSSGPWHLVGLLLLPGLCHG